MTKQEFENRYGGPISQEKYNKIEFVYNYYPGLSETTGKDQIVKLYHMLGMRIIDDMFPRAKEAAVLEEKIRAARTELEDLQNQYKML